VVGTVYGASVVLFELKEGRGSLAREGAHLKEVGRYGIEN